MLNEQVTINSRKYDLSIRRTWKCRLIDQTDQLLKFEGEFDLSVDHPDLGKIAKGTVSIEYYWLDRWYNVFRFQDPDGTLRNFYCNINMPPTFKGGILDYVDLDIDIVVWPDGRLLTLDEDDFVKNAAKFDYPSNVISNARSAVDDIHRMILERKFPF